MSSECATTAVGSATVSIQRRSNMSNVSLVQSNGAPQWLQKMCAMLISEKTKYDLKSLHVDDESIGDASAAVIGVTIGHPNCILKELYLFHNNLGPDGANALAEGLCQNKTVTILYLSENSIGFQGAAALANMLKQNKHLKEIYLRDNDIRNHGVTSLARALMHNQSVETLDLRKNNIRSLESAIAVAEMLRSNRGLKWLWLDGNKYINYQWIERFVSRGLKHNFTLEGVDGLCTVVPSFQNELDYYLSLNRAGRRLLWQHDLPTGVWSRVLGKESFDPDVLYYFLQAKPDLIQLAITTAEPTGNRRRKRRRQN